MGILFRFSMFLIQILHRREKNHYIPFPPIHPFSSRVSEWPKITGKYRLRVSRRRVNDSGLFFFSLFFPIGLRSGACIMRCVASLKFIIT
ncbi:hypothetical protein K440DRAFT_353714 [Wilcoxina mikolae CBS 423.85]|nr:hypothetical protein K440DRAFT_353714 [Wilcoxina mikolae CBS 423.85]